MIKDNYKYFKEGDSIVCIKDGACLHPNLFDDTNDEVNLKLYKTYTFDKYLIKQDGGIIYDAMVLKNLFPLYDGKNFMLLSEFRKLKLKRLKRKLFYKKTFGKFVNIK